MHWLEVYTCAEQVVNRARALGFMVFLDDEARTSPGISSAHSVYHIYRKALREYAETELDSAREACRAGLRDVEANQSRIEKLKERLREMGDDVDDDRIDEVHRIHTAENMAALFCDRLDIVGKESVAAWKAEHEAAAASSDPSASPVAGSALAAVRAARERKFALDFIASIDETTRAVVFDGFAEWLNGEKDQHALMNLITSSLGVSLKSTAAQCDEAVSDVNVLYSMYSALGAQLNREISEMELERIHATETELGLKIGDLLNSDDRIDATQVALAILNCAKWYTRGGTGASGIRVELSKFTAAHTSSSARCELALKDLLVSLHRTKMISEKSRNRNNVVAWMRRHAECYKRMTDDVLGREE